MARVEVEGLNDLLKAVRQFGDDAVTKSVNKEAAEVVKSDANRRVPVVSGALLATGRTSGTKAAGVVRYGKASVPYAAAAHFGHNPRPQGGSMPPNPWLYDALDARGAEVVKVYEQRLKSLAAKF